MSEKKVFQVVNNKEITEDLIKDIIVDGLEATTYWAFIDNSTKEFKNYGKSELTTSEIIADIIIKGGKVNITDIEKTEEIKYPLTLERILIGIKLNADNRPFDCDLDNYDDITTDCIFQYAIFDDVLFS